jgi:hypothetical protein
LKTIVERLTAAGVQLHLSQIKGPVGSTQTIKLLQHLAGSIYRCLQALRVLDPNIALETPEQEPHTLIHLSN